MRLSALIHGDGFLSLLHDFIGDVEPITFMSDRLKCVIKALKTYWSDANMRFYARHVYANFRGQFRRLNLRSLFWAASRATNRVDF